MSSGKFSGLRRPRANVDTSDTPEAVAAADKAADPVRQPATPAGLSVPSEPQKPTKPKKEPTVDMLIPLPKSVHEALRAKSEELTENAIGNVSMRQIAIKLIKDGLSKL